MKIKKVFNNNVVLTENKDNKEMVVMGKGLAFQKKIGQTIDDKKIEKTFLLESKQVSTKLAVLLTEISEEYLLLSEQIISYAKTYLQMKLDDYLYIALTDHLSFAINRYKQGIQVQNIFLWEIRKHYKREFEIGLKALDLIEEKTGITMNEDEAASIALHLVNSQLPGENFNASVQVIKMVRDLLNIVTYHYQLNVDEHSLNYERFITHLKFFAWRLITKETLEQDMNDDFLFTQIQQKYTSAYHCSMKISDYVNRMYEYQVSRDEIVYLTLHIQRVTSRQEC